jgi:hypothetical protein
LKEKADLVPITGPIKSYIDGLPSKKLKQWEGRIAPTLLVLGTATVIGPDIAMEVRIRAEKSKRLVPAPPQVGGFRSPFSPARGTGEGDTGANGHGSSAGGWASSVPTNVRIPNDVDV